MAGGKITRVALGKSTTDVDGDFNGFYKRLSMAAGENNAFKAKVTNHGEPKEPELKNGFFVKGWWSSDEAGNTKITEAIVDDTVYFHIETRNIPNGKYIGTMLYDDDVKRATEEKDSSNGSDRIELSRKDSNDFRFLHYREVQNNKVVIGMKLEGIIAKMIAEEEDKTIELFFACSYEGENVELPIQFHDYLKVKELESLIIFVNGYWNISWLQKDLLGFSDGKALTGYWGTKLIDKAINYFNTNRENMYFINGASTAFSRGSERYKNGKEFTEARLKNKESKFYKTIFEHSRNVLIVSHSMGGAFAEGMLNVLKSQNVNVKKLYIYHLRMFLGFL